MRVPPDQSGTAAATRLECDVHVTVLQMTCDRREPRTEQQHVDAMPIVRDRVQEMQKHARVAVHRSGDVAEDDQRRRLGDATPERERRRSPSRAGHPPQGRSQVDARSSPCPLRAPHRPIGQRQAQARDHPSRCRQLLGGHRREVLGAQHLPCRPGEGRIQIDVVGRLAARHRSAAEAAPARVVQGPPNRRGGCSLAVHARQQRGDDLFEQARIAPEQLECLIEQREMLAPRHEDGLKGGTEVRSVRKSRPPRPRPARRGPLPDRPGMPHARRARTKCSTFSGSLPFVAPARLMQNGSTCTAPRMMRVVWCCFRRAPTGRPYGARLNSPRCKRRNNAIRQAQNSRTPFASPY